MALRQPLSLLYMGITLGSEGVKMFSRDLI